MLRLQPDATALDQVVVTATRTPKALKDAPVVTRLITANDIKIADATNIQDLLTEQMPGLEFGYAMNQETSLNMNGFGGNAVLFLVDGERLAGETMDNVDYSRLNLDNVGRIEIVKGAASALYGANAVAGVINIISRETASLGLPMSTPATTTLTRSGAMVEASASMPESGIRRPASSAPHRMRFSSPVLSIQNPTSSISMVERPSM